MNSFILQTIDWTNQEKVSFIKGVIYVNGCEMVALKTGKSLTFIRKIHSIDDDVEVRLSRFGLGNF
jgi:hypothetical protein